MTTIIPLIRAAALTPMLGWMVANGRPVHERLTAADLAYVTQRDPNQAIPLLNVIEFLRALGRREGADICCRVVSAISVRELAMLSAVALGAATPRQALQRVSAALPRHCTHEHITVTATPEGVLVQEGWALPLDDEALHLVQQYVAALIRSMCGMTGTRRQLLSHVEMAPHPQAGLEHLRPWFGAALVPARGRTLSLLIESPVADRPLPASARGETEENALTDRRVLRGAGSLAESAREVIAAMLDDRPTVERLAAAAGLSVRTLQRRLAAEGTSFGMLLDSVRRDAALGALAQPTGSLKDLSASLAYSRQSALTRSIRRWTGRPPSQLRKTGSSPAANSVIIPD